MRGWCVGSRYFVQQEVKVGSKVVKGIMYLDGSLRCKKEK